MLYSLKGCFPCKRSSCPKYIHSHSRLSKCGCLTYASHNLSWLYPRQPRVPIQAATCPGSTQGSPKAPHPCQHGFLCLAYSSHKLSWLYRRTRVSTASSPGAMAFASAAAARILASISCRRCFDICWHSSRICRGARQHGAGNQGMHKATGRHDSVGLATRACTKRQGGLVLGHERGG